MKGGGWKSSLMMGFSGSITANLLAGRSFRIAANFSGQSPCADCPSGKSVISVKPFARKNPACPHRANQWHFSARLTRQEGRLAIVTKRAGGCGGRGSVGVNGVAGRGSRERSTGAPDERRRRGRQKRVVLAPLAGVKPA